MSGTVDEIRKRQSRLRSRIDNIRKVVAKWKHPPLDGVMMALAVPQAIRERLDKQCVVWGAMTKKQMLGVCISLGLQQLEELGAILQRSREEAQNPPDVPVQRRVQGTRPEIKRFMEEHGIYATKSSLEEVQEVPGSSDQGDS